MAVVELFSKRRKRLRGDVVDIFQYEVIEKKFRNQVIHIIEDTIGPADIEDEFYKQLYKILCKEFGKSKLGSSMYCFNNIKNCLLLTPNYEECLDIIELCFITIDNTVRKHRHSFIASKQSPNDAIEELNDRFKENGIGYRFENGFIIRIDDELIHQEAVKPAIQFLNEEGFEGAREEFLGAFDSYKRNEYKDSLVDCLKSIESTLKTIFDIKGWEYNKNAPVKSLVKVAFDNNLIPEFWQNHFSYLDKLLECSVPVGRNKLGGHGQGSEIVEVPEEIVSYMLHMTASTIVFLAKASK